jgi:hypothetical protein
VRLGERVWVNVTITNETAQPVAIHEPFPAFLEVRDAGGQVVGFGRFQLVTLISGGARTLQPGESAMDRVPWAGERNEPWFTERQVAPGQYWVRAAVAVGTATRYAYSAPVTVVLTAH